MCNEKSKKPVSHENDGVTQVSLHYLCEDTGKEAVAFLWLPLSFEVSLYSLTSALVEGIPLMEVFGAGTVIPSYAKRSWPKISIVDRNMTWRFSNSLSVSLDDVHSEELG